MRFAKGFTVSRRVHGLVRFFDMSLGGGLLVSCFGIYLRGRLGTDLHDTKVCMYSTYVLTTYAP